MQPDRPGSLAVLARSLASGALPLDDYLKAAYARLQAVEPALQTLVPEEGRFERLAREARALGNAFPDPLSRPPLFGVLLGVKDIIHVTGLPTRAGSRLPPQVLSGAQAPVVTRLTRAGALVLGKTRTTEFAYFSPGPTRNPNDPSRTPGGSSSGSAAAVAAGLCPLSLGTQTVGSVIRPASFCGVVGFKPSLGRISTEGIISFSPTVDQVGFFCGSLADAVLAAGILLSDLQDSPVPPSPVLGVPSGDFLDMADPATLAVFNQALRQLQDKGFGVLQIPAMPDFLEIKERHESLIAAEAAQVHDSWFREHRALYSEATSRLLEQGASVDSGDLPRLRQSCLELRRALQDLMDRHDLSAWISPAAVGPATVGLQSTGDPVMNLPWTHAGLPVLSLPLLHSREELPIGLQLAGRFMQDAGLLSLGRLIDQTCQPG
ncbi:MAG: amidase [Desulfohalobiaceae bacterium]